MGAVARAEQFEQRARKPQARGKLRVIASIFAVRGIRKQLAEVARTIDLAAARAEAIASLASSMDRSEEHSSSKAALVADHRRRTRRFVRLHRLGGGVMDHSEYDNALRALAVWAQTDSEEISDDTRLCVGAIMGTVDVYRAEMAKPHPRLSCLRVALKALAGALRDRMGE